MLTEVGKRNLLSPPQGVKKIVRIGQLIGVS